MTEKYPDIPFLQPLSSDMPEPSESSKEGELRFHLKPEEQPEEFFARMTDGLKERYADLNPRSFNFHVFEGSNVQGALECRESVRFAVAEVLEKEHAGAFNTKFSEEKRSQIKLAVYDALYSVTGTGVRHDAVMGKNFDGTNRHRFFSDVATDHGMIPHSQTMFGLYFDMVWDGETAEEVLSYMHEKIDDKTIVLLGGGDSNADLIRPDLNGALHPKKIINVDPYLKFEDIEKGEKKDAQRVSVYVSLPIAAEKTDEVVAGLASCGVESADEVWASFSVPYYLKTEKEIDGMFKTAEKLLAPGGAARFYPLTLGLKDGGEIGNEYDEKRYAEKKKWFAERVDLINQDSRFNAYIAKIGVYSSLIIKRIL